MSLFIIFGVAPLIFKKLEKWRKLKNDEEREVPDPWESIEEVLEVVLEVLEVFLEESTTIVDEMNYYCRWDELLA